MAEPQPHSQPVDLTDVVRRASILHQRGALDEAEALYRQALAVKPDHFDALHLCGVLMHQRGRPADALKLIAAALKTNARVAPAHANLGAVLAALERHHEALTSYERAIALKPDFPMAHNNRGNALRALKRPAEALASFEAALALTPDYAEALNNRGNALQELGRADEALASYDRALAARPHYTDALVNRGTCLRKLQRDDEALASFARALACEPDHPAALKERGHLLRDRGELADALACYDRVVAVTPDDAETHANRGLILRDLKRYDDSFAAYDRALALKPDYAEAIVARGNVFYEMHAYDEALAEYDRALALRPDFAQGLSNRGNALRALGRKQEALADFDLAVAIDRNSPELLNNRGSALLQLNRPAEALADFNQAMADKPFAFALVNRGSALRYLDRDAEALECFDRAIALEPDLAEAHWNKALLLLSRGDFERGWPGYEWRWRGATDLVPRGFTQPQWTGEALHGKTILLHAEQGFGDTIQFLRYLPMVKEKGAKIILELPDDLRPLLGAGAIGITLLRRGDELPPFELHSPLMSLPLAFGTRLDNIPADVPYLWAPDHRRAKWLRRLPPSGRPRVGLVWSGKPSHKNDHNRSIPLARLAPLLSLDNIDFVSLQREYRMADQAELERWPNLAHPDTMLADFADTAAVIDGLDLTIAVDTAVAHLAGALGKPVWILISHIQDWRWLVGRSDSPWYPTARLIRQPPSGDWDGVIAALAHELTAWAAGQR